MTIWRVRDDKGTLIAELHDSSFIKALFDNIHPTIKNYKREGECLGWGVVEDCKITVSGMSIFLWEGYFIYEEV